MPGAGACMGVAANVPERPGRLAQTRPLPHVQVRRGVPVLAVRRGVQTAAFLGPVAALVVLSNPAISPPVALAAMTAALGITSLGERALLWLVGWWWDAGRWVRAGSCVSCRAVPCCALLCRAVPCCALLRPAVPCCALPCPAARRLGAAADPFPPPAPGCHAAPTLQAGQAGFVANMSDVAPRHAGLLFGLCNTFGSLAGILGVSGECASLPRGHGAMKCRPGGRRVAGSVRARLAQRARARLRRGCRSCHPLALTRRALCAAPHAPPPAACGFVLEKTGSFGPVFAATAALYVLGTLVWNLWCRADPQF